MRRVHVIVSGRVQGVGYRYTLRLIASEHQVAGWVRNLADGSVEAELEGPPDRIDTVLTWMTEGPPGAIVLDARVRELPAADLAGFAVRDTA